MTTYTKQSFSDIYQSLTNTEKAIFDKIFTSYDDKTIIINDIEFAKLPAAAQTKLLNLINKQNYS